MGRAVAAVARRQDCSERLLRAFAEASPDLLRALGVLLESTEDAQDAAQEAFLKCWRAREQVAGVHNLRAWIFRVGLNSARDLRRNVWRRRALPLNDRALPCTSTAPSPPELLLDHEALERLRAALTRLRTGEREVFLLRQNSALTYEEIARLRDAPVGTVKTQMRSALQKLRAVLQER
jgi:RNA polymerase sigma-70 factor (ECF subfamily)